MSTTSYHHPFRVALHDIDAAGVMFFGHLFRHAHDAYEGFMADIGFPLDAVIGTHRWRLPLVHAEADYLMPIRHGEALRVLVTVAEIGESAFTMSYRFEDERGQARATARTVHVHLADSGAGGAPLPLPLRDALRGE